MFCRWLKRYSIQLLSILLITKIQIFWRLPLLFASVYLFIAFIFAIVYSISGEAFCVFGEKSGLDFPTSLYYSMVTITTLGYGDIFPISGFVRLLAGTEAFLGVLTIGAVLAVFGLQLNGTNLGCKLAFMTVSDDFFTCDIARLL